MALSHGKNGWKFPRKFLKARAAGACHALCVCLFIGLALTASLSDAAAAGPPLRDSALSAAALQQRLLDYFETVVFDREFQPSATSHSVSKWDTDIRVSLQGGGAERHRQTVKNHIALLSRITGLKMDILGQGEDAGNIVIHFVAPEEMATVRIKGVDLKLLWQMAQSRGCYFVSISREHLLVRSDIVVNRMRDDQAINHCLLEEITQSLGLPNDSDLFQPSLFSDHDNLLTIPDHDRMLLKILYHPDMRAGFFRLRARNAARRILSQMLQGEEASKATVGTDDPLPRDVSKIPKKPAEFVPIPQ